MTTLARVGIAAVFFVLGCLMTALGSTLLRANSSAPQNFVVADMSQGMRNGFTPQAQAFLQRQLNAYAKDGWAYVDTNGPFVIFAK